MTDDKVSPSELSRVTRLDRATIRTRLANLPFTLGQRNSKLYDRKSALALLLGNALPAGEADAKRRREIAEAERSELRVAQIKGELVSADAMRSAAAELVKTLYQRIVRVEPSIIGAKCVGKTAIEIETITRDSMAVVFNELKLDLTQFMSIEDTEAANEVEDEVDSGD